MNIITVRRKDNGKLKIMDPANFDPAKHDMLGTPEDPKKMNKEDLAAWLAGRGIEAPEGAKKADLVALIPEE